MPVRCTDSICSSSIPTVLRQLAADLQQISPLKTSWRKHRVGSKKRDASRGILQVSQAVSRADIVRFIRHHTGYHQCFAEMDGGVIAPATYGFGNRQGWRSLRRCLDGSQAEEEQRPETSNSPERYPRRTRWMRLKHFR